MHDHWLASMGIGYLITIAVETTVLMVGLSKRHSTGRKLFAGAWLTACTYPVVWLVLPPLFTDHATYLWVAETFAPVAECLIFWCAFLLGRDDSPRQTARDMAAIIVANLASFGAGVLLDGAGFWEWVWGT
jgi:hypothetical protein